jgi:hypothetical protein
MTQLALLPLPESEAARGKCFDQRNGPSVARLGQRVLL